MFVLAAHFKSKSDTVDQVASLLKEMAPLSLSEPGCRAYAINQSLDDPTEFMLYEQYDDAAAFAEHGSSPHFERIIRDQVLPLLESRERKDYALIAG